MSLISRTKTLTEAVGLFESPVHPLSEVRDLVDQIYGLEPQLIPLSGERDQNFLVAQGGSKQAILKISHPEETETYTAFQVALLRHLETNACGLSTPHILPTRTGAPYVLWTFKNGQRSTVRLVSYLDGTPKSHTLGEIADWTRKLGALQGRLCRAMAGFDHPGALEFIPWNAVSPQLFETDFLAVLGPEFTEHLTPHLERLARVTLPGLQHLQAQIIHNDLHPGNILLNDAGEMSSVIDFGDAIKGPVVQDLAVSAVSLVEAMPEGSVAPLRDLVDGFCEEFPIDAEQLEFLHDAMIMRGMLCVVLGRMKDQTVPAEARPRAATQASEKALRMILNMHPDVVRGLCNGA
ncbi:MAG: phosphotransferase [Pseudomonadota bacterium]